MNFIGENFDEAVTSVDVNIEPKQENDETTENNTDEASQVEKIDSEEPITELSVEEPTNVDGKESEKEGENDEALLEQTISFEKIICEDANWDNTKEEEVQAAILAAAWNAVDCNTEKLLAEVAMERVSSLSRIRRSGFRHRLRGIFIRIFFPVFSHTLMNQCVIFFKDRRVNE